MLAASTIALPLTADDRFRLRLEEDIRNAIDRYPNTTDPRDMLLHAVVELGRKGTCYERGVALMAVGACLETLGAEFQKASGPMIEQAARAEGVE